MSSDSRYHHEVGIPLYQLILKALVKGACFFNDKVIKTLIDRGWYDMMKATLVDQETTDVFEHFLCGKVDELVNLGLREPDVFDIEIGSLRSNFKIVAKKTIDVLINGGRYTNEFGQRYDGSNKTHVLLDLAWVKFYKTLKTRFDGKQRSIGKSWSLVAIELRCRAHDDERFNRHTWRDCCPFATKFKEAFDMYGLRKVEEMMVTAELNWFK